MFNFIKRLEKVERTLEDVELDLGLKEYMSISPYSLVKSKKRYIDALYESNQVLMKKLSLLESHLNLTYIPASEEKKEARYEKKAEGLTLKFNPLSGGGHLCGKDCAVCRSMGPAGTSVGNPVGNPVGTRMSEWEASTRRPTQKIKKTKKN